MLKCYVRISLRVYGYLLLLLLQQILLPKFNTTQHALNGQFAVAIFIIKNRGPPPAFDCFDSPSTPLWSQNSLMPAEVSYS
jgi:hypothetical protein